MQGSDPKILCDELPAPLRLAVAYAPARARGAWTALLVLDRRLARVALAAGEPVLAQIRLAWWRDRFAEPASAWPLGEPLLAALHGWDGERAALERLVDGWEGLVGVELDRAAIPACAEARVAALVALDRLTGGSSAEAVTTVARSWALADLTQRLGEEPAFAARHSIRLPRAHSIRLPRAMRPLVVLDGLAQPGGGSGWRALGRTIRLGMVGR